jgi:hypothetical protein
MVARRDIAVDEEICIDYATSGLLARCSTAPWGVAHSRRACVAETTSDRVAECLCGSAKCRRKVRAGDWRSAELQKAYAGHFLSYIQRRLDA